MCLLDKEGWGKKDKISIGEYKNENSKIHKIEIHKMKLETPNFTMWGGVNVVMYSLVFHMCVTSWGQLKST